LVTVENQLLVIHDITSLGCIHFADGSTQCTAAQVTTVIKPSISINTIYQNNYGKPLYLTITLDGAGTFTQVQFRTGPTSPPGLNSASPIIQGATDRYRMFTVIVLAGDYYQIVTIQGQPSIYDATGWY
jgi:hypothetical protein